MGHINELIDYTVIIFIVYKKRVLLVNHKEYDMWLPIGGHVELDEDPEQALFREIEEECNLNVEIFSEKPSFDVPLDINKPLYSPTYMEIHRVNNIHKHVALIYFGQSESAKVVSRDSDLKAFHWFTKEDLDDLKFNLRSDIRFYVKEALKKII